MRKTLYFRIILAYLLFGIFGFIAVATLISRMTTEYCIRSTARTLYGEAARISDTYATDLYNSTVSLEYVQSQMEALSAYMGTEIWILNPSGRMVVNSKQAPDPEKELIVEGFDSTITAGNYYTTGDFFNSFDKEVLSVVAPITSDFKIRGYVIIHLPSDVIQRQADSMLNISYIQLVILIILSLIILLIFTEYVYRPLRRIITAAEQYALGNMYFPAPVEREDELGYLAASLGYMADTIARSEDDQKKFIANVSHDFRSPLTSMRGFLEAMLDGTIPPERYDHYLRVVLGETERLTKLTQGLLTLNNLNSGGILLQRTDFDINAVIRSVAASFEQTCRSRNLQIRLLLMGKLLYVNADLEKIQQVLYNLVDNAVKFSRKIPRSPLRPQKRARPSLSASATMVLESQKMTRSSSGTAFTKPTFPAARIKKGQGSACPLSAKSSGPTGKTSTWSAPRASEAPSPSPCAGLTGTTISMTAANMKFLK